MASFMSARATLNNEPVVVYYHGDMTRDFTFIDYLIKAVRFVTDAVPSNSVASSCEGDSPSQVAPFRVVNIGNSEPVQLTAFI